MNDMNEYNLKINRLLSQYDYLELYLEEINFKYKKYNIQFLNEYYEMNPMENNVSSDKQNNTNDKEPNNTEQNPINNEDSQCNEDSKCNDDSQSSDDIQCNDDIKEIDPYIKDIINKMYKKLSLKTHPDKQNGNNDIFIKVLNAYKSNDILMLLKISKQINANSVLNDILYDNNSVSKEDDNDKIYKFIESEIDKMENKINELKHHVCWLWCNSDQETKKKFKLPK